MPDAFGDEDRPAVYIVEQHRVDGSERRRPHAYVDDDVEDASGETGHVLRLPRRNVGVVDASQNPALRHRAVRLRQSEVRPVSSLN